MKTCMVFAAAVALLGARSLPSLEEHAVKINDTGFSPEKIEVKVGEKVVWLNVGAKEHTVTAVVKPAEAEEQGQQKPLFDSGPITPGKSFEYSFTKEGTYEYRCMMHKGMSGTVVVKP